MDLTNLTQKSDYIWELPKQEEMNVPGRIYGDKQIIQHLIDDVKAGKDWNSLRQIYNVASLPGIQKASLAMPDVHPGYGFPIGGVGAFDAEEGVISMAGVGFDINCGVRTLTTPLKKSDIEPKKKKLAEHLYKKIPAGLGSKGDIELTKDQIDEMLVKGAEYAVENGYGLKEDLKHIEEEGRIEGAKPENVSDKAKQRQFKEMGTLGSGNHYLEVQYVDEIFDEEVAGAFGLERNQILVSLHCGSRALGHQIGTDYLKKLEKASKKYDIPIREKELVCAPFRSEEGQQYFSAVKAGINCAFANRQILAHLARKSLTNILEIGNKDVETFYEITHNTSKLEEHEVNGEKKDLIVHRKGATRGVGPGRKEIPSDYRDVGQPILIGGTMGTSSYILHGTKKGMKDTFGSACHGAGRIMSRTQAKKQFWGEDIIKNLESEGIIIKGHSKAGVAEEAPGAYKDVEDIVNIMHNSGIAKKVARVKPLISIKG